MLLHKKVNASFRKELCKLTINFEQFFETSHGKTSTTVLLNRVKKLTQASHFQQDILTTTVKCSASTFAWTTSMQIRENNWMNRISQRPLLSATCFHLAFNELSKILWPDPKIRLSHMLTSKPIRYEVLPIANYASFPPNLQLVRAASKNCCSVEANQPLNNLRKR